MGSRKVGKIIPSVCFTVIAIIICFSIETFSYKNLLVGFFVGLATAIFFRE
jgi:hypothetical protein